MGIPSNSSQSPSNVPQQPTPPVPENEPPKGASVGNVDPTGVWAKFLSTPGNAASAEDVKMFMQGLLKMFNVLIQQQNQAAQRANEKLKKAIEGED
jgi:hypothetical protein